MFGLFKKKKEEQRPRTLMGVLGIFYHSQTYPEIPSIVCVDGHEFGLVYDLSRKRDTNTLVIDDIIGREPLLEQYYNKNDHEYQYVPITLVRHIVEDIHGGIIGWNYGKEVDEINKELNKCIPPRGVILPMKLTNSI